MTAESLARSLIQQARQRLRILALAEAEGTWHIVVREAQECVELALKGLLRVVGVEPPKLHNIGGFLIKHRQRISPQRLQLDIDRLAQISDQLQKERERSFYGDVDFIPQEHYSREQAEAAIADATYCVEQAEAALAASK